MLTDTNFQIENMLIILIVFNNAIILFLRDTHVVPKLVSYEEHCRRDRWQAHRRLIACISGVSAINPLVAFYDIHGGKREVHSFILSRTPHGT
jgi:hypothetical protein